MTTENLWNQPGIPHKGWRNYSVEDLGDDRIICEMCGEREVRWVHIMTHPTFHTNLRVGCICAENMEEGYNGKASEKIAKRKSNWLTKWSIGHTDSYIYETKKLKNDTVIIFEVDNLYYWFVKRKNTDEYHGTQLSGHKTSDSAKTEVWDMYADEGWL